MLLELFDSQSEVLGALCCRSVFRGWIVEICESKVRSTTNSAYSHQLERLWEVLGLRLRNFNNSCESGVSVPPSPSLVLCVSVVQGPLCLSVDKKRTE